MATAHQILSLLESHAAGDDEQLYAVALQIAAAEARRGREARAGELRAAVETARQTRRTSPRLIRRGDAVPSSASARGALEDLARVTEPRTRLDDLVLDPALCARLERVLHEQRQRTRLRDHGRRPDCRLLLVGPPGVGKTMTAAALAGELGLVLVTVRLDTLITRYLGETAAHLRRVFDEIRDQRAVYLFDEFDALGARRGAADDVGEMRRVVNSFLQFLEEPNSTDSPIVATTNRPASLDGALARRFDAILRYALPTPDQAARLLELYLGKFGRAGRWSGRIVERAVALGQAEIALAVDDAIKEAILDDRVRVETDALQRALDARLAMQAEIDADSHSGSVPSS